MVAACPDNVFLKDTCFCYKLNISKGNNFVAAYSFQQPGPYKFFRG
jgi:hypothetical protein